MICTVGVINTVSKKNYHKTKSHDCIKIRSTEDQLICPLRLRNERIKNLTNGNVYANAKTSTTWYTINLNKF